jgi:hypothetical protein
MNDISQIKIARFSGNLSKNGILCFFSVSGKRHFLGSGGTAIKFGASDKVHSGFSGSTYAIELLEIKNGAQRLNDKAQHELDLFIASANTRNDKFFVMSGAASLPPPARRFLNDYFAALFKIGEIPYNIYLPLPVVTHLRKLFEQNKTVCRNCKK